ncbi:AAA family ATPase [Oceanobacillus saliphilus]|uniref:AAA family ATPase n=1 Tax=Oceanobacillus saliphilus TaxID=2925834 RepID=UPI00201D5FA2|nr:AAA family ATPase [Oceanobacillus saliphilus]
MRLHSLKIEGFRRHQETDLIFSDATFLIGSNNVGKSSVLKAIEYLLTDTKKMSIGDFHHILNENGENEQVSQKVILTAEFRNVPHESIDWIGFNRQRLFEYTTTDDESDSGLGIFYRKTYEPNKNYKVEMKQYKISLKEKFSEAKNIQDFIDSGLNEDIIKTNFKDINYDKKMSSKMLKELEDIGYEELFDIDYNEVLWFENPGGIAGNVISRLPKYLLIPDRTKSEELSGNNGALMKTLKSLFEDVRDSSDNFKKAQHFLGELAKELDPNDEKSDFAQLLSDLNKVVGDVFPTTTFIARANLSNADEVIVPNFDVQLGSNINTPIDYQGAGVVRSAIFAMLRYRSIRENQKRKKSNEYVRPLLIAFEEPEIYLHPQAAQQMRETIYDLSADINNQIICTTHSPYMIDLSKNTHQVLNALSAEKIIIDQDDNAFQSDKVFSNPFNVSKAFQTLIDDDKSYVKMLLKIDDSITKIFFTKNVLIVEGDTEEVVVRETILRMPKEMRKEFAYNWEVVRARGKATIISLIKYMKALGIKPYVIHDRDFGTPKAYQMNRPILEAMNDNTRIVVLEECIEDLLGYEAPSSNKPYKAYQFINEKWGGEWDNINPQWRTIIESMMSGYSMETLNEAAAAKEE